MKAASLIHSAESQGIFLWVEGGQLRYKARHRVSDELKDLIKAYRLEIINLLSEKPYGETVAVLPPWCRTDCPSIQEIDLPNEGSTVGCVHPATGSWRRLDRMTTCPTLVKEIARPLPTWCFRGCSHYHGWTSEEFGTIQWCTANVGDELWRLTRLDKMMTCPKKEDTT